MCWHWILTRGSHWVSIDAVWNGEVFCYGCQCSESDWTQGANVIYWCSVGPRSPKHRQQAGPKTHKWDIDHVEGVDEKKKKVIFNHGVAHLVYRVVNTLSASLECYVQQGRVTLGGARSCGNASNRPQGAGVTAPQGVQMKREIWAIKDSIVAVAALYYTALYCEGTKERAPLLQLCVFIFSFSPWGQM